MKRLLFLFFLSVLTTTLPAQRHLFKIEWKGDSIGYLLAEKTISQGLTTFNLKSVSEFSMILTFNMIAEYNAVYHDGQLLSATSRNLLNDKERSSSRIKYLKDNYEITVDGDSKTLNAVITESIATMYFSPPTGSSVFSERYGQFCPIRKVSNDHYQLVKPDDRINDYIYSNGSCQKIMVDLAMAEVSITRIDR